MILAEFLLSTSIISLAIFFWAFFTSWKSDVPSSDPPAVPTPTQELDEDDPDPNPSSSMSGSERCDESLVGSNETPLSSTPGTPRTTSGLSRRQRKNRKRDRLDGTGGSKNKKVSKSPVTNTSLRNTSEDPKKVQPVPTIKSKKRSLPCKQYTKLNLEDNDVYYYLSTYISPYDQLRQLGFPMDSSLYPGKAYIYRDPEFCSIFPDGENCEDDDVLDLCESERRQQFLDVNAREFVPSAGAGNRPPELCSENNSSTGSDSEMGDWGSDRQGETHRKLSIDDLSGIPLNATAKEFVPSNVSNKYSQRDAPGKYPHKDPSNNKYPLKEAPNKCPPTEHPTASKLFTGAASSPNLFKERNTPPPLISAASSVTLRPDSGALTSDAAEIRTSDAVTDAEPVLSDDISGKHNGSSRPVVVDVTENNVENKDNVENEDKAEERKCVRCKKGFYTSRSGEYLSKDRCSYHWGKLRSKNKNEPEFTCCGGKASKAGRGCSSATVHVWTGLPTGGGMTGPLEGYVKTKHRKSFPQNRNYGVYGLDCEMVYTAMGLELGKVTVVGIDGRLVYESLVLPDNYIVDYNTRFSGITSKDLEKGQKKNLKEVQNDLMGFINADTVLIGHGLENDLRALKLIHSVVIDTTAVFPHFYGLPFRRSLRSLISSYLKRDIQASSWGHDSYEDARACMELMLWKTRKDLSSSKLTEKLA